MGKLSEPPLRRTPSGSGRSPSHRPQGMGWRQTSAAKRTSFKTSAYRWPIPRFLVTVILVGGFLSVLGTSTAGASETASPCGSSTTPQWAGEENATPPSGGFLGIEGAINHYDPRLCTGSYNTEPVSTDWIMELDTSDSDFVQDGFVKWAPDGNYPLDVHNYFFWQCIICDNAAGDQLPTSIMDFQEVVDNSDESYTDLFGAFRDGSNHADTILDVQAQDDPGLTSELSTTVKLQFSVNAIEVSGEVHDYESQMPGDRVDAVQLSDLEYLDTSGWETPNLNSAYWNPFNGTYGYPFVIIDNDLGIYDTRYTCETGAC